MQKKKFSSEFHEKMRVKMTAAVVVYMIFLLLKTEIKLYLILCVYHQNRRKKFTNQLFSSKKFYVGNNHRVCVEKNWAALC